MLCVGGCRDGASGGESRARFSSARGDGRHLEPRIAAAPVHSAEGKSIGRCAGIDRSGALLSALSTHPAVGLILEAQLQALREAKRSEAKLRTHASKAGVLNGRVRLGYQGQGRTGKQVV